MENPGDVMMLLHSAESLRDATLARNRKRLQNPNGVLALSAQNVV